MDLNKDLTGMSALSSPFQKTRVLVAFALLLSVSAPLVQYACGVTGETTTTSTLVAEIASTDAAPCGVLSTGVHDRLCEESRPTLVCEGDACTTDTVEKQLVMHFEPPSLRVVSALSSGALLSREVVSSHAVTPSRVASGSDWSARAPNRIPVRLRSLSFRL